LAPTPGHRWTSPFRRFSIIRDSAPPPFPRDKIDMKTFCVRSVQRLDGA